MKRWKLWLAAVTIAGAVVGSSTFQILSDDDLFHELTWDQLRLGMTLEEVKAQCGTQNGEYNLGDTLVYQHDPVEGYYQGDVTLRLDFAEDESHVKRLAKIDFQDHCPDWWEKVLNRFKELTRK